MLRVRDLVDPRDSIYNDGGVVPEHLRVDAHRGRWPKNAIKAASDAELIDACTPPAYAKSSTPDPYA